MDDDSLFKTIDFARKRGYNPADIDSFAAMISQQNQARRAQDIFRQQQEQTNQQPRKRGGFGSFLLGLLPGGSLIDKKLHGENISGGDIALEAGLTAIPFGLGKLFKGAKAGVSAVRGADRGSDILRGGDNSVPELGKVSKSLLRQSTIAPTSTINTASEQNRLINLARSLPGLRGSSARKFQNVEGEIGKMTGKVNDLYGSVNATIPADAITQRVGGVLDTITNKGERNAFSRIYNDAIRKSFGNEVPSALTPTQVNTLRRSINSQASNVFKKIEKGSTLSATDNAILALRDEFGTVLDDLAPEAIKGQVKPLNRNISTLMSGMPEFKRASEEGGKLPVIGRVPFVSPLYGRATQGGADLAGRVASNKAMQILGPQAGVRLGADVLGAREGAVAPPPQGGQQLAGSLASMPEGDLAMPGGAQQQQSVYSREAAAKDIQTDLQRTGGKNMEKYMQLYEFLNPEPAQGSATQEKQAMATSQANSIIDQLQQGLQASGGGRGLAAYPSKLFNLITKGEADPELAAYDALRQGTTSRLARSLGEVGTLTDQDIKRALSLIPSSTDASELAQIKIEQLRQLINAGGGASVESPAASLLAQYGY